jgi:hypothetical protein
MTSNAMASRCGCVEEYHFVTFCCVAEHQNIENMQRFVAHLAHGCGNMELYAEMRFAT